MQINDTVRPKHPQYSNLLDRHNTFGAYWPENLPVEPTTLTLEGFFYTGKSDWIVCFHCGLGLKNVTFKDDIVDLHLKASNSCRFLIKRHKSLGLQQMRIKVQSTNLQRKVFVPREQDFVLMNNLKINAIMNDMGNQLNSLKTKYRSRLAQTLSTINFHKRETKSLKENIADLLAHKMRINKEIEILMERFECPICLDAPVTMVTNCGHVYCRN